MMIAVHGNDLIWLRGISRSYNRKLTGRRGSQFAGCVACAEPALFASFCLHYGYNSKSFVKRGGFRSL